MSDIFKPAKNTQYTRRSTLRLHQPAKSKTLGQAGLSYLGPKFWNPLSSQIKSLKSTNSFRHAIKHDFFNQLQDVEEDCFIYYTKRRGRFSGML